MNSGTPRAELDGPFRAPERLALVMPLLCAVGLMLVVCAAATAQSTLVVSLAAAVGFGLCALAPMALVELYVGRPLRALLANLRAARDGLEAPGAPTSGVIGDLVAVARDIRAGRANAERMASALTLCEQTAAVSDKAVTALRLQCEALTAANASSAQSQIAEVVAALQGFAPTGSGDGGLVRIEQALVHLTGLVEPRDTDDKLAGVVQLIEREAQAVRDCVATASLTVRNNIAATVADDTAAQSRHFDRLQALEARILSKLAAPETAGFSDAIRSEAETTRRTLLAKIAESSEGEAKTLYTLTRTTEKLRNAIDRLDALSASAATLVSMQNDDLKAALRALEGEVAGFGGALAGAAERTEAVLARLDADSVAWEAQASALTLAASVDAQTLAALRSDIGTVKARVAEVAPRAAAVAETLAQRLFARLDALDAAMLAAAAEQSRHWETALQSHAARTREAGRNDNGADSRAAALAGASGKSTRQTEAPGGSPAEPLDDFKRRLAASH